MVDQIDLKSLVEDLILTALEDCKRPPKLKGILIKDKSGYRARYSFYIMYNWDIRLVQFFGIEFRDKVVEKVFLKLSKYLKLKLFELNTAYAFYAKLFHKFDLEFYQADDKTDIKFMTIWKEICIIVVHGYNNYLEWLKLEENEDTLNHIELDGGPFSTIHGIYRFQGLAIAIAEFCKGIKEALDDNRIPIKGLIEYL